MRKIFAALLCAVLLTGLAALPVQASSEARQAEITYRDIKIVLDGQPVSPRDASGNPVEPFILDGKTYLPVRAVADALGLKVRWRGADSTVILERPYESVLDRLSLAPPETPAPAAQTPAPGHNAVETVTLNYRDIRIMLNGMVLQLRDGRKNKVEPFVMGGTTYLPVRAVAEALGLGVEWDAASATVRLSNYLVSKDTTTLEYDGENTETIERVYEYDARGNNVRFREDYHYLDGTTETTERRASYDSAGRLTRREYSRSFMQGGRQIRWDSAVSYTYDGRSGLCVSAQTSLKSGAASCSGKIEYEYDESGRLTAVRDDPAVFAGEGLISGLARTYTRSYNADGRVSQECLTVEGKKGSAFENFAPETVTYSYSYDGDNRRAEVALDTGEYSVLQYDIFGEAVSVPGSIRWSYDRFGREVKAEYLAVYNGEERVASRTNFIYDVNRLVTEQYFPDLIDGDGIIAFTNFYDDNGNVYLRKTTIRRPGSNVIEEFEYIKVGE